MPPDPTTAKPTLHRERVAWTRWCPIGLKTITTRPYVWTLTEPDGYERSFDCKADALRWLEENADA